MPPKIREHLTPLEQELLEGIERHGQGTVGELRLLREDLRTIIRMFFGTLLSLLVGLLFLAAVIASGHGVDPRPAAEAVQTLAPALSSAHAAPSPVETPAKNTPAKNTPTPSPPATTADPSTPRENR